MAPLPDGFDSVTSVFEDGYCHALAVTLSRLTGWPVVGMAGVRPDGRMREIDHYAALRPDGLLVDVHGARELADISPYYRLTEPIDPEGLWLTRDMEDAEDVRELAEEVARDLLAGMWV